MQGTLLGQPWETSALGGYIRGRGTCKGTSHRHLKTSAIRMAVDSCILFQLKPQAPSPRPGALTLTGANLQAAHLRPELRSEATPCPTSGHVCLCHGDSCTGDSLPGPRTRDLTSQKHEWLNNDN